MTKHADATYRKERRFTYRMRCPECGWVGAVIMSLATVLDPKPTGSWKCLRMTCGETYSADPESELDAVPTEQLEGLNAKDLQL